MSNNKYPYLNDVVFDLLDKENKSIKDISVYLGIEIEDVKLIIEDLKEQGILNEDFEIKEDIAPSLEEETPDEDIPTEEIPLGEEEEEPSEEELEEEPLEDEAVAGGELDLDEYQSIDDDDFKTKKKKKKKHQESSSIEESTSYSEEKPYISNESTIETHHEENKESYTSEEYGKTSFEKREEEIIPETYSYETSKQEEIPTNEHVADEGLLSHLDLSSTIEKSNAMVEGAYEEELRNMQSESSTSYDNQTEYREETPKESTYHSEESTPKEESYKPTRESTSSPIQDKESSISTMENIPRESTYHKEEYFTREETTPKEESYKPTKESTSSSIQSKEPSIRETYRESTPTETKKSSTYESSINETTSRESYKRTYEDKESSYEHIKTTKSQEETKSSYTGNKESTPNRENSTIERDNSYRTNDNPYEYRHSYRPVKETSFQGIASTSTGEQRRASLESTRNESTYTEERKSYKNSYKENVSNGTNAYSYSERPSLSYNSQNARILSSAAQNTQSSYNPSSGGFSTEKYQEIMKNHSMNVVRNGVVLGGNDNRLTTYIPGKVIPDDGYTNGTNPLNKNTKTYNHTPSEMILNTNPNGLQKSTPDTNSMRDKAMNSTSRTSSPVENVRHASLNSQRDFDRDKNTNINEPQNEEKAKTIKAMKRDYKEAVFRGINSIGESSYQLVTKQVDTDATEGYRQVKKSCEFVNALIGSGAAKTLATIEINKLRNSYNLGQYMITNNVSLKDLSSRDFKNIVNKSRKGDFTPLKNKQEGDNLKALSKKQTKMIEQSRNMLATRGIILKNLDKLSDAQKKIITDNKVNIFNFASKHSVRQNMDITVSILRQNDFLKKVDFATLSNKKMKALLDNKVLSTNEQILLKNYMQNKKALKTLNNLERNKLGKVIGVAKNRITERLQDNDAMQGLNTTTKFIRGASKVSRASTTAVKGSYKVVLKVHHSKALTKTRAGVVKVTKGAGRMLAKTKPGQITTNAAKTTIKVIGNGINKLAETKGVKIVKKVGSTIKKGATFTGKVAAAPFKKIHSGYKSLKAFKSNIANRISNNKLVRIITSPFKGIAKFLDVLGAIKKWIMKFIIGFIGGWVIVMLIGALLSAVIIPAILSGAAATIIMEDEENIQAWVDEIKDYQAKFDEDVMEYVAGSPKEKDVLGNTIDKYGMPETIGPNGEVSEATLGYEIKYLDANGYETIKADNSKDIMSFLAVYLQQDFDLGDGYVSGMVKELFDKTHPEIVAVESDIYFCDYGCQEIEYSCNELAGVEAYNTYGTREFNEWGCDPYYTYCDGCECPGHDGEHDENCPEGCTSSHTTYCDGCECPGHKQSRCSTTHTQKVCYGHRDVVIYITTLYLKDLLDENYFLCEHKDGIHPLYNSKIDSLAEDFSALGGWNEDNQEWAWNIYEQDWYEVYGITLSSYGLSTGTSLSPDEIAALVGNVAENPSQARSSILEYALRCVGQIPYYWGGKTNIKGLENNSFGALTTPDAKGRDRVGLDCSGFVGFVFNTVLDTYIGSSTSNIGGYCYQISRSDLQPGDLGFLRAPGSSDNHVGIFLGYDSNGQMLWVHENGSDNNVACNNANYWTKFYRPLVYGD